MCNSHAHALVPKCALRTRVRLVTSLKKFVRSGFKLGENLLIKVQLQLGKANPVIRFHIYLSRLDPYGHLWIFRILRIFRHTFFNNSSSIKIDVHQSYLLNLTLIKPQAADICVKIY